MNQVTSLQISSRFSTSSKWCHIIPSIVLWRHQTTSHCIAERGWSQSYSPTWRIAPFCFIKSIPHSQTHWIGDVNSRDWGVQVIFLFDTLWLLKTAATWCVVVLQKNSTQFQCTTDDSLCESCLDLRRFGLNHNHAQQHSPSHGRSRWMGRWYKIHPLQDHSSKTTWAGP